MSKSKKVNCAELVDTFKGKHYHGIFSGGIGKDFDHCIERLTQLYWDKKAHCDWCLFDLLSSSNSPKLDSFFKSVVLAFGLDFNPTVNDDSVLLRIAVEWLITNGTEKTYQELVASICQI